MKRRLVTSVSIAGPVLLLSICALIFGMGVAGRWLSEEQEARIVRIVSLAPLQTPQAVQSQDAVAVAAVAAPGQSESPQADAAAVAEAEPQPANQPAEEVAVNAPLTVEEADQAPTFVSAEELAYSLLLEGVSNGLVIPKLSLAAPIIDSPIENQTWKVDHLGQSIGHLEGTAAPGSNSNVVYAAHVTVSRDEIGPFINLDRLAPGDIIYVYNGGQEFQYVVEDTQTVDRTSIEVTHASDSGQITLITCSNWDEAAGRYANRYIVRGRLSEG